MPDMTYQEALTAYVQARDELMQWEGGYGPAGQVTDAEDRLSEAAHVIAAAVVEREGL